ncbi:MAG: hypothetical protein ABI135_07435 [Rhodoferax sp.]
MSFRGRCRSSWLFPRYDNCGNFSMNLRNTNMKIHTLLLAAVLASGGVAFAQTTPATPAVTPTPAPAAKAAAEHKAPMHKMSMHRHAHKMAAAEAPAEASQATTREERMATAEADYKASMESKSDQPATSHRMSHHHGGHHMHMHHKAKAAPAS